MLFIRYRWKGRCPQHPRYDPGRHGEGAIKGNCPTCSLLFRVYEAHRLTIQVAASFDEVLSAGQNISLVRELAERVFTDEPTKKRLRSAS